MRAVDNPYTPNAGREPVLLVGRNDQIASFDLLLQRLEKGRSEQSLIVTGLRGVGKTVLLNVFGQKAEERGWAVVEYEVAKNDETQFRREIGGLFRKALFQLSKKEQWKDLGRTAAGVLRSFTFSIDPQGALTAGLDADVVEGQADSGLLSADIVDLMVAMGEAAREQNKGILLLIDEIQFLKKEQLEALVMGLHKAVQKKLPITLVGAGLPQIAELAGDAKSYSERLFKFPMLGPLSREDADEALVGPARAEGAEFDVEALERAFEFTGGYPYFIQELGYAVWPIAENDTVHVGDIDVAMRVVEDKLDSSFFKVRMDRTTELESAYLRAMAQLGPEPQQASEVAKLLGRTSEQCGPTRSNLVAKGLLYTPSHGLASFTVPHFDQFMLRFIPKLVVPPFRPRKGQR